MHQQIIITIVLLSCYAFGLSKSITIESDSENTCLTDELSGRLTQEEYNNLIERRNFVRKKMKNNLFRNETDTFLIPIVFHNLYKIIDGIAQNSYCDYEFDDIQNNNDICNERMLRSIAVLNAQYATSGIQFILHPNYPEMLSATDPGFNGFFDDVIGGNATTPTPNIIKKHYNIPNSLNIYTHECLPSSTTSCNSSKLGFSTYPWSLDKNEPGVFIKHKSLPGSEDIYSGAKSSQVGILAHEISHFFSIQHINGTWFAQEGNTPRELVDSNDCEIYGDLICDTPGSPGYVPLVSDTLSAWYFNNENRECIYHGYGGDFDPETNVLKIGGYNHSFYIPDFPGYDYCESWGFEDPYGLENCNLFTNYDNAGDFFGTRDLAVECLNENKSEYASECPINYYNHLPIGNNFMQAGTTTLASCAPRPIGHADYDESNHGFTTEQFENIRTSLELDYTACNIESACNTGFSLRKGIEPDMLIRSGSSSCLYPCNKTESVEYYQNFRAGCLITDDEYKSDYSQYDCLEKLLSLNENNNFLNFEIDHIYPNPFNPITSISYSIDQNTNVEISILDINGRLIEILNNEFHFMGNYTISWDATSNPSGLYFIRLKADTKTKTHKIILMK